MLIKFNNDIPIYVQLADKLEESVIEGAIKEGERMPSQIDLGKLTNINPATAGKALTLLLERGVVEKRRGLGMFVTRNAVENIKNRRKKQKLTAIARSYLKEGATLGVSLEGLINLLIDVKKRDECGNIEYAESEAGKSENNGGIKNE